MDIKTKLSTIWLFAILSYLYCDIVTLFDPEVVKEIATGTVGGVQFTPGFLLGISVMMEVPIAMVLLSRFLNYTLNRWLNIAAGIFMTVVQLVSLFVGTPAYYYIFFTVLEVSSTIAVVWIAWNWVEDSKKE